MTAAHHTPARFSGPPDIASTSSLRPYSAVQADAAAPATEAIAARCRNGRLRAECHRKRRGRCGKAAAPGVCHCVRSSACLIARHRRRLVQNLGTSGKEVLFAGTPRALSTDIANFIRLDLFSLLEN